jgi:hypothetical protein
LSPARPKISSSPARFYFVFAIFSKETQVKKTQLKTNQKKPKKKQAQKLKARHIDRAGLRISENQF